MQQRSQQNDDRFKRLEAGPLKREADTVLAMIRIYCRAHHASQGDVLCTECQELDDYAMKRLACCPFKEDKPVCAKCKVHCYKPEYRKRISEVMRFAGPRVLLSHPLLALEHMWKSLTVTPPEKPRGKARQSAIRPAPVPSDKSDSQEKQS